MKNKAILLCCITTGHNGFNSDIRKKQNRSPDTTLFLYSGCPRHTQGNHGQKVRMREQNTKRN
jgi:hypothetical protein